MNKIKSEFSIKDLENLTGIKAHTLRIWEKRYNLLSPERTKTNIRFYSLNSLQKLLNINLLYKNGFKISIIADLSQDEILQNCTLLIKESAIQDKVINDFKIAMYNFDTGLFNSTYESVRKNLTFEKIYLEYFFPFLEELGYLWQTDTIKPAHEHFISCLIKQKVLIEIDALQSKKSINSNHQFVLFLPEDEIHELGLLLVNFIILKEGFSSIYLGQNIPTSDLTYFNGLLNKVSFVTYFTVKPESEKINDYVLKLEKIISDNKASDLYILGRKVNELSIDDYGENVHLISLISDLQNVLQQKKELEHAS